MAQPLAILTMESDVREFAGEEGILYGSAPGYTPKGSRVTEIACEEVILCGPASGKGSRVTEIAGELVILYGPVPILP
jgi:hypothetical protein